MRVLTLETLRAERRAQELIEEKIPYTFNGRVGYVTKRIVAGEMEVYDLPHPVGEFLSTPANLEQIVQKTVLDLELGREQVPLLYTPIYRRVSDQNLTEWVEIQGIVSRTRVVFMEHVEGQEVHMGEREIFGREAVPIITYAAGFEWTEDMVKYDKTWEMTQANQAVGEAYNALLNHLHLSPIITYNYPAKNKTAAVTNHGSLLENIRATLRQAIIDASQDKDPDTGRGRNPTILLAHPSRRMDIEEALQRMQIGGTIYPALNQFNTLIFYEGYRIKWRNGYVEYPGVDPNKAYLIDPQQYFVELVKHDLQVDATGPDLKRLIAGGIIARARRGLYCAPERAVQEVTLPS